MDIFTYGRDPWGREVFTHVAWDPTWVFLYIGLTFLVAHAAYVLLSAHRGRSNAETDALETAHADLPDRVTRHSFMARLFHWVMASAIFVLLVTAFFPIIGMRFDWVNWHWTAGLVLTGSIVYHIIHATFWLDFWSIWVGPKDIPGFLAEMRRELGHAVPGPKSAKYPIGNRLYHLILVFAGTVVTVTGLVMLTRIGFERRWHGRLLSRRVPVRHGLARVMSGPWPLVAGAVGLALANFATLALAGRPWGITSGFALWGSKAAAMIGFEPTGWTYWSSPARHASLMGSVFEDTTSVMNFGILLGALMASGLAGRFKPVWSVSRRSLAAAIGGGLLLGYGARLAYGCNIGAYFSGVASGSLHGWLWLVAAFAGSVVGTRLRPTCDLVVERTQTPTS